MTGQLANKIAIVTGASRGFGAAVALRFALEGATTIAVAENAEELAQLAQDLQTLTGDNPPAGRTNLQTRVVDLADPAQTEAFADWVVGAFDRLDIFVHAAAILRNQPLQDLTMAQFEATMEINFMSMARLVKRTLPHMAAAGSASIINISSRAGIQGFAKETEYCAAKFALEGFSYSLALELKEQNIAVNLVSPGVRIKPTSVTREEFARWPPERQAEYNDPAVMADAFVFLARQNGQGITGQRFNAFELAEKVRAGHI